jgi:menaquinone-dependent protoporphyrinogen IX oxidase
MCDDSSFLSAMEEATTSDIIANVRTDSPGEDYEHMLISSNHVNGHRPNVVQNILEAFQTALATPITAPDSAPAPAPAPLAASIRLERESDPLNEFIENDAVFLDSFPLLFFLGKGWKGKGSINATFVKHLMSYYDGRFARRLDS